MSALNASPLVAGLIDRHGMALLHDLADAPRGLVLLFLPSHARPHLETPDIAAVLPDLLQACAGLVPSGSAPVGAVADAALEVDLRAEIDDLSLPALVLLHDGRPAGAISRMRDWDEYGRRLTALLAPFAHSTLTDQPA